MAEEQTGASVQAEFRLHCEDLTVLTREVAALVAVLGDGARVRDIEGAGATVVVDYDDVDDALTEWGDGLGGDGE